MIPNPHIPADIISHAEAKFWQEQAARAPSLLRQKLDQNFDKAMSAFTAYKVGGVALGGALGVATFTKAIPGRWKWASGVASALSLGFGLLMGGVQNVSRPMKQGLLNYADALEKSPELQQKLADFLSSTVTAEQIQHGGLEAVVHDRAIDFVMHTPYLQSGMVPQGMAR
ncbi:MAG: hypothetical protein SFX19_00205 [Alphaproteobacteria bacterium]|nr:hypothetical protein [Alphaproteobacteria bacterium]